jgi:hypothetical protein
MVNERKLTGYGTTAMTFEENGKFYVRKDSKESLSTKAEHSTIYIEINKQEYLNRLRELAKQIAKSPQVKIEDVIYDALRDYTLADVANYEKAVRQEADKKKPVVKTVVGRCCELTIGNNISFVLRH